MLNDEIYRRKDITHFEVSWVSFNKLIFDYYDIMLPMTHEDAELEFLKKADNWELAPGIERVLELLAEWQIPIGIVSNTAFSCKTIKWELEQKGILSYFQFVITSSDIGIRKPHPFITKCLSVELMIGRPGCQPNEELMV